MPKIQFKPRSLAMFIPLLLNLEMSKAGSKTIDPIDRAIKAGIANSTKEIFDFQVRCPKNSQVSEEQSNSFPLDSLVRCKIQDVELSMYAILDIAAINRISISIPSPCDITHLKSTYQKYGPTQYGRNTNGITFMFRSARVSLTCILGVKIGVSIDREIRFDNFDKKTKNADPVEQAFRKAAGDNYEEKDSIDFPYISRLIEKWRRIGTTFNGEPYSVGDEIFIYDKHIKQLQVAGPESDYKNKVESSLKNRQKMLKLIKKALLK